MGDVIESGIITKLPLPPEKILNGGLNENLREVIVIGLTQDEEFYFAMSSGDRRDILWLLELAKGELMKEVV